MISNYKEKKLVEYLQSGQKVLIRFGHGLGDTLMFMPIFYRLQRSFPEVQFDIYLECGQEEIFKSHLDKEGEGYDHVFHLDFPMAEGSGITKAQKCCIDELGIQPQQVNELPVLPKKSSPFVACHFHGTALPHSVGCTPEVAGRIWQEIKDAGKIPIECHFEHIFHNPVNSRFDFINRHVRDCMANLHSLIGLIQHSFAFIGVASGPFVTALCEYPHRVMFIQRNHKTTDYTHFKIPVIDLSNQYIDGTVRDWLLNLGG